MAKRIIECSVKDEYILGSGVPVGAEGSHDDVILRIAFNEMWYGLNIYAVWKDALGGNGVVITLDPTKAVVGDSPLVYDVPVPPEAKKYAGKTSLTLSGYSIVNGAEEDTATNSVESYFRVLPSGYKIYDDGSVTPTLAQQLLNAINAFDKSKINLSQLESAVDNALTAAKANGDFKGEKGDPGESMVDKDKAEIVQLVIDALPKYDGGVIDG